MDNFLIKIYQEGDTVIEISVVPSGRIIEQRLSPTPPNKFWAQAEYKNSKGKSTSGAPVTDHEGKIKTFNSKEEALQAAIDFFGINPGTLLTK